MNEKELCLEYLTLSGKILASALNLSKELLSTKITPLTLDNEIEKLILSKGAKPSFKGYSGYLYSSCISVNSQIVHSVPTNRPFKYGDIVTVDIGVSFKNNHTDAARTYVVGNSPDNKTVHMLETLDIAHEDGINKATSNNKVGDISYAIQRILEFNNYKTPLLLGGHGIGLVPHSTPFIPNYGISGTGEHLEYGTCLAIEPIVMDGSNKIEFKEDGWTVYSPEGVISVHKEDTIIVTDENPIILTRETLEGGIV